jgi:PAS domain S-box-containing protein
MSTNTELKQENEELRRRLEEAEETLHALYRGEVDAVMVAADREQVFTLETADTTCRLLVEQMPQAAATLTVDGEILSCNHLFADLLGHARGELIHRHLCEFVASPKQPDVRALLRESLGSEIQFELELQQSDGAPVPVYLRITALKEGPRGQCLIITDQTEQRHYQELQRTQESLRVVSERLELAQEAGRIGTYEWDIDGTGTATWSAIQEDLFGLPKGGFGGRFEDWINAVHPDDRKRVESEVLRAISERDLLDTEYRILRPDGEMRWLEARARVYCDQEGQHRRMVGVSRDITRRKRAVAALEESNAEKDEFLAILAHELRNPLAPILSAAEIIRNTGTTHPDLQWAREILDRQARIMARLIEDLVDASHLSRQRLGLRKERIELAAVVETALETSLSLIEERRHQLTVSLPPGSLALDADPVRLAQVFANLLNNAAKYTETGGNIWLTAVQHGTEVVVSVRDNGIGIAPEAFPHIFDIFAQASPLSGQSRSGLGIGLSLVKGLVEMHGGRVELRSPVPGEGSEFLVHLPLAQAQAAAEAAPEQESAGPASNGSRRVLVVDDNRDSADSLARMLELAGHEVHTAYDGEQALRIAAEVQPDIALLDIGMPRVDGYEACRRMRKETWGERMLLIAITGWGQEADRRRTVEAGFDHHLVKPVYPATLMELLASPLPAKASPH